MGIVHCASEKNQNEITETHAGFVVNTTRYISELHLHRYRKKRVLKPTHYGSVWHGYDVIEKIDVAVKQNKLRNVDGKIDARTGNPTPEDVRFEAQLHSEISRRHPEGIVRLLHTVERDGYLYLITEFAEEGSLFDYVDKYNLSSSGLSSWKRQIRQWFITTARAVKYLHDRNICHKDIGLQNILIKKRGSRKVPLLADFGLAEKFSDRDRFCMTRRKVGKINCASPECYDSHILMYDAKANDVWCLGVVLFVCLTQCNAYNSPSDPECRLLMGGRAGIRQLLKQYRKQERVDEEAIALMSIIFQDEKRRATIDEVLSSPYCRSRGRPAAREAGRRYY